ncbi:hypothetical protein ACFVXE_29775 [Streptomyces sp. NPDC058231]|uniref:hypothetical protein n=1 Tax=Streptomyces sp. NPDC058231 TaxID=3346392 RepID=UPI0036E9C37B
MIAAVITAIPAIFAAVVALAALFVNDDEPKTPAAPNPAVSSPSPSRAPNDGAPGPSASAPSSPETSSATKTYVVFYDDQKMSVGLPAFPSVGSLDFDEPISKIYTEDDWAALKQDAEEQGVPYAPDLGYSNDIWGNLFIGKDRPVAQLDTLPDTPEECATDAKLGAFTGVEMAEWPLKVGSGFCLVTDQGSVVRLKISRLVGGDRDRRTAPPERIEFSATLWKQT